MSKHPKKKKRTQKTNRIKKSPIQLLNIFIVIVSVILLAIIVNTFTFESKPSTPEQITQTQQKEIVQAKTQNFEEKTKALEIEYLQTNNEPVVPSQIKEKKYKFLYDENESKKPLLLEENNHIETIAIIEENEKEVVPTIPSTKPKLPKLAIIIDDVSASHQVKRIKNLNFPVTMAFLPPTKGHKNSAKIAQGLEFYMVHLPLEAGSHKYEEEQTLYINVSLDEIKKRIAQIKKWYPDTKYINNHTGSKFTAHYPSMDRLFSVLKEYNYTFLDSKTTAKSVVKDVSKKHNVPYLTRNIFLDNKLDKNYITSQLKKAILIAKQKGEAIAIGHPHKITIQTLKDSSELFKGVELVFLNQL
jgi:polysaccharide deacetylase 2 family uncharacterized protein YibQ